MERATLCSLKCYFGKWLSLVGEKLPKSRSFGMGSAMRSNLPMSKCCSSSQVYMDSEYALGSNPRLPFAE